MEKAERRLHEEKERVDNYLDPSSEPKITRVVENELIKKQVTWPSSLCPPFEPFICEGFAAPLQWHSQQSVVISKDASQRDGCWQIYFSSCFQIPDVQLGMRSCLCWSQSVGYSRRFGVAPVLSEQCQDCLWPMSNPRDKGQ